ncbi:MAG TPA: hypothetical protein H9902_06540 [Candidatus Stackebrandtia faecavium]|nr:hypothetical protein [Candidatus Stackebrandtia faecavium]
MTTIIALFMIFCCGLLLWGAISPRSMWQTLQSWQFKNPEANEPSEAAFAFSRVASIVGLVIVICGGVYMTTTVLPEIEEGNQRESYEECLQRNDDDEGLLSAEDWCEDQSPSAD